MAVDARFVPGTIGGVETVIKGLAQGFADIPSTDLSLTFVTYAGVNGWIHRHVGDYVSLIEVSPPARVHRMLKKGRIWAVRRHGRSFGVLPGRDRTIDGLDADVVHFPRQGGFHLDRSFIYQPHDLQHRHLPEFFTARQIASREIVYGSLCRRAAAIAVGVSWVKHDLVEQMGIDPQKIYVIPLAPLIAPGEPDGPANPAHLGIPNRYIIYPAASWPHKNHRRLLQAIALLRARGTEIPVVLTGPRPPGVDLSSLATACGVGDLIVDLGYLGRTQVATLTAGSVGMIMPSLFEAASFPVWEAFRLGTPVACSNVTSLPLQVGTAGLLFDPCCIDDIAEAVRILWEDSDRRMQLIELGRSRVNVFNWASTARQFQALYRQVGGRNLSDADRHLLEKEPLL